MADMTKTIVCAFLATIACGDARASENEKYPVPMLVSEVKVARVGDVLFRYVEFFEDYPCIRFETMQPISHKLIHRREVCTFRTGDASIDVRRKDLAGVGYKDYRLEGNVFHFTADIVLGGSGPGLAPLRCKVVISEKGKLTEPACQEGGGPADKQ